MRGRCRHVMGEVVHEDSAGAMGVIHYNQTHDLITPYGPIEVMNVCLDLRRYRLPRLPAPLSDVLPALIPLHPACGHRLNRMVHLEFLDPEVIFGLLRAMLREQDSELPGAGDAMSMYFRLFLIECCRAALEADIEPVLSTDLPAASSLEAVRRYVDERFVEPLTLADLVKASGMSRAHFCCTFRRYTGETPMGYVAQRRIEHAMVQLRNSDEKILSIALDCGFQDLSYFNRVFKRVVDCTPSMYRARE
ncbi:MAG: helix-turn-helix transcriptional regulator [Lentisphaerae bacterium]|nr:helix-turn-helix transcriptional regulator [Lentisphaerota bacterium]